MKTFKPLTTWTIVFNFFILIGAGHGVGFIGLFEIMDWIYFFKGELFGNEYFSLSPFASYDKSIIAAGMFSFIGQALLLLSMREQNAIWFLLKSSGLIFLWTGFYYLTHNFAEENLAQFSFYFGIPFLISSVILAYLIAEKRLHSADATQQEQ